MLNRNCWTELVENSWILKSTLTFFFLSFSSFFSLCWLVYTSSQAPFIFVAVSFPLFTVVAKMEESGKPWQFVKWAQREWSRQEYHIIACFLDSQRKLEKTDFYWPVWTCRLSVSWLIRFERHLRGFRSESCMWLFNIKYQFGENAGKPSSI